jgi:putative ABC transport system permease protein
MRPEAPAHFRRGLLERAGLNRLFSLSARMIVRNFERRPLKALLSATGIAFAVAILLVGRYFFDAVDYIKQVQFRSVQREDVTVLLNGPRSSGARDEFKRLPGVLGSEPFREIPVRLRFEHRSRRVALLGLDPGGELRRLLDERLQGVDLPPDGLVLTGKLAQILGVSPGQLVTVEVLEGERPVRQVPVRGLVDELIGVSAYMDVRALNRLMREGGTVSGTFLSVDSLGASRLYGLLKRTPVVMGVSVREAMLASFEETVARSLNASTLVLTVFACTIACGVVYNGARVSLSERGTELASLRVLGFSQREVAAMLLGEQAAITLFAVPFGFAIGFAICALTVHAMESELYRMPLVITGKSYAFAFLVVAVAACVSGLLILRRIRRLDLVAVLKSRE